MFRNILNSAVQKKFFLMFFTSVIYIVGLFAYFADKALFVAFLLFVLGVFAILKNYLSPKLVLFWYFMFFFGFFNTSLRIKNTDALYQIAPQNAVIQGQIVSIPVNNTGFKTKFFVDVSKIDYNGKPENLKTENIKAKTLVTVYSNKKNATKFNIGDNYTFEGKLRAPFEVTNPSQFDYGKYLKNFNVFSVFYANDRDCMFLPEKLSLKWKFMQGLNSVRNDILQTHAKYLKSPNLELLGGIVFGDDAVSTPDDIKDSFKHSGLLHILAASGMNVALIYGIWFFILRKFRVPFNITVSSGIFVVIFYALMTGLGASVMRATFMLIFILVGKLIDRDAHSISLLSFVALLMLIYNPAFINDVGFQLSFMVTFGLLVMAPLISKEERGKGKEEKTFFKNIKPVLLGAVFVPLIAQIWVSPIQMYYFNSFSLYSLFANILSLPFVTVISFGGFVSSVLALIKPISDFVCMVFDFVLNPVLTGLVMVSDYFSNLSHSLVQIPQPSMFQIILYYTIVLLITALFKFGQNKKLIIATSTLSLVLVGSCFNFHAQRPLETIAFDVQNADAFLIKTPQNKYFLIDSGKTAYKDGKTPAKMIILEYLKDKGIKNIEGLIITHFDSDHAGGAVDLISNLNIKNVYVNSLDDKSNLAKKIYKCVKLKKNTHLVCAKNNEVIYTEKPTNHHVILNLFQDLTGERNEQLTIKNFVANVGVKGSDEYDNENSIIILISDKNFDELFMGDAGVVAFDKVQKYLPKKIEVLKVGHHGAKNVVNKEMLDRINPELAIISTGLNNYGHPNGVTLDILERHKVKVLRTDRKNAIKLDEDVNGAYQAYSYDKNKGFVKIN